MEFQLLSPYKFQVAGHACSLFSSVLIDPQTRLTIKAVAKEYCEKEALFYENVSLACPNVRIPKYYGVFKEILTDKKYIVIEDLLSDYQSPSIIDIKIGLRTYDDEACKEKREKMIRKSLSTTSRNLFFRISGMKIWDGKSYTFYAKSYCNTNFNVSSETLSHGMKIFLPKDRTILATLIQKELSERIFYPLESQCEAELYSSSLLIFYDGSAERIGCALVDFAHSKLTPGVATQKEYVEGIKNVISLFKSLCDNKPDN